jgi:hypothetical protein
MFGPTDEAFSRFAEERGLSKVEVLEYLGEGVLAQLLKYHVVPGEAVYAKDLKGRATVPTTQGYDIDIDDMKVRFSEGFFSFFGQKLSIEQRIRLSSSCQSPSDQNMRKRQLFYFILRFLERYFEGEVTRQPSDKA